MEQRRTRRFTLQLPLSVTRAGSERLQETGYTQNISSGGVLFTLQRDADLGGPIEYVITLNTNGDQLVNLRCMGKVVRCQKVDSDQERPALAVAATLERYEFLRTEN